MAEIQPSGASFGIGTDPTVYDGLVTLTRSGNALVFNAALGDADFRIAGDTDANLFVADASTDRIGIGVAAPLVKLHIDGNIRLGSGANTAEILTNSNGLNLRALTGSGTTDVLLLQPGGGVIARAISATMDFFIANDLEVGGDLLVDGGDIGVTGDTDLIGLGANAVTVRGSLTLSSTFHLVLGKVNTADMNANIAGSLGAQVFNINDATYYGCTVAGGAGSATWVAFH